MVYRDAKLHYSAGTLFFITWLGLLAGIRGPVRISMHQRILCVSFSMTDSSLSKYRLLVWSNFNFLHNSQWISFLHAVVSHLVLFFKLVSCILLSLFDCFISIATLSTLANLLRQFSLDIFGPYGVIFCCY